MADVQFSVAGIDEVVRNLARLGRDVQDRIADEAVEAGAEVIRARASEDAPRDTGFLSENIIIKYRDVGVRDVGPSSAAYYGLFIEVGTSRIRKRPWLRPAYDAVKGDAMREAERVMAQGIEREAMRL